MHQASHTLIILAHFIFQTKYTKISFVPEQNRVYMYISLCTQLPHHTIPNSSHFYPATKPRGVCLSLNVNTKKREREKNAADNHTLYIKYAASPIHIYSISMRFILLYSKRHTICRALHIV